MWKVVFDRWQKPSRSHDVISSASSPLDMEHQRDGTRDIIGSPDNNGKDRGRRRNGGSSRQTISSMLPSKKRYSAWLAVLSGAVLFATLMVVVDVMKRRRIKAEIEWDKYYLRAAVGDYYHWQMGWRLEDLAKQTANQNDRMSVMLETLKQIPRLSTAGRSLPLAAKLPRWVRGAKGAAEKAGSSRDEKAGVDEGKGGGKNERGDVTQAVWAAKVLAVEEGFNRIVAVECSTRPEKYLQVGMHPMEASAETSCKVYSAAAKLDPHALFEKIELGEGKFALRAFSNGRFVRVVPPPSEVFSGWNVWTLEVGAPEIGLPEVFQMRDGMVYSEVMHGYLSCSGAGSEAEVKGFVGEYLWYSQENYRLVFNRVSEEAIERARILRDLSRAVTISQRRQAEKYVKQKEKGGDEVGQALVAGKVDGEPEIIAICVPMTSRGTDMNSTRHSPVWSHAFQTFLSTTDWSAPPQFRYHWYFGFDAGDPIYDGPNSVERLHRTFEGVAKKEFVGRGLDAAALLTDFVRLKAKYYTGFDHAPSYVVSALIQDAYNDGCDYFYQINDDTVMNSGGWAETFTAVLRTNPLGRNVGVTGPSDTNNRRILTHAFVHRTHMEIFGRYFPMSFRNWWSDDWISNVYGSDHTLRDHIVTVTHDVSSQKLEDHNRYDIDYGAQHELGAELQKGHVKLSRWLKGRGLPPPSLPMVCGYAPLVDTLFVVLQKNWDAEQGAAAAAEEIKGADMKGGFSAAVAAAAAAGNGGGGWRDRTRDRERDGGGPVDLDSPERPPKRLVPELPPPPEPPLPPKEDAHSSTTVIISPKSKMSRRVK